jgi:predicted RNA-binding protein YlqC (UPF0109 family)
MELNCVKEMLAYIVENLVEHPEEIVIEQVENHDTVVFQLKVAPSDMGKVIGRQGRIAKEIRVLVKNAGMRENKRILVDILD